jgi:putative endonuclease
VEQYFVYILKCSDDSYYTGMTYDLENRIYEHATGYFTNCYTFKRRPVKLVWYELTDSKDAAHERERQIKKWTRKKKEALILGDETQLVELSKNIKSRTTHS